MLDKLNEHTTEYISALESQNATYRAQISTQNDQIKAQSEMIKTLQAEVTRTRASIPSEIIGMAVARGVDKIRDWTRKK